MLHQATINFILKLHYPFTADQMSIQKPDSILPFDAISINIYPPP
jgi:hypothetical protein